MSRRVGIAVVLFAVVAVLAPAATARQQGGLTWSYKMPSAKHAAVYGIKVTVTLPTNMKISGGFPLDVKASNGKSMPKGTTATATIVATGQGTWTVLIALVGAGNPAGKSLNGTIVVPGPLATYPSGATAIPGDSCKLLKTSLPKSAANWTLIGPPKLDPKFLAAQATKIDGHCKS